MHEVVCEGRMLLFILIQYNGWSVLEVVVYYAVCGTAQGLKVTQITEVPHSARRTKQLLTVVLPLLLLK